jgi:hypothetical protein
MIRYPGLFSLSRALTTTPRTRPVPEPEDLPGLARWLRYTTAYFEDRAVIFGSDFLVHRQRVVRF